MKLTWFGGTTIRIHIGGQILVADAELAPQQVDRGELLSGADRAFGLGRADPALPQIDPATWRPRPAPKAIDDAPLLPIDLFGMAGGILVDAVGEPPLLLLAAGPPPFGRWADAAVAVLFGNAEAMIAVGAVLLDAARPRLVALAATDSEAENAIAALRDHLHGAALVALESGLALEI